MRSDEGNTDDNSSVNLNITPSSSNVNRQNKKGLFDANSKVIKNGDTIAVLTPAGSVTVGDTDKLYAHPSRTPSAIKSNG